MNQKLIEGAMGMLARVIPPEEYAKANAALGQIVVLMQSIDDRMKRIEAGVADLSGRVGMLEMAASVDSPAFGAMRAEMAMWLVPGAMEEALAPARKGALNDH